MRFLLAALWFGLCIIIGEWLKRREDK